MDLVEKYFMPLPGAIRITIPGRIAWVAKVVRGGKFLTPSKDYKVWEPEEGGTTFFDFHRPFHGREPLTIRYVGRDDDGIDRAIARIKT